MRALYAHWLITSKLYGFKYNKFLLVQSIELLLAGKWENIVFYTEAQLHLFKSNPRIPS